MPKRIRIDNLGYSMDDRDLARLFTPYGAVRGATVCTHRNSGQSTGVGFIEMESETEAEAAIVGLDGRMHCGRVLSLRRGSQSPAPDPIHPEMFGPMNMADMLAPPDDGPERRGLP